MNAYEIAELRLWLDSVGLQNWTIDRDGMRSPGNKITIGLRQVATGFEARLTTKPRSITPTDLQYIIIHGKTRLGAIMAALARAETAGAVELRTWMQLQ